MSLSYNFKSIPWAHGPPIQSKLSILISIIFVSSMYHPFQDNFPNMCVFDYAAIAACVGRRSVIKTLSMWSHEGSTSAEWDRGKVTLCVAMGTLGDGNRLEIDLSKINRLQINM